jgi:hypothetical protein
VGRLRLRKAKIEARSGGKRQKLISMRGEILTTRTEQWLNFEIERLVATGRTGGGSEGLNVETK